MRRTWMMRKRWDAHGSRRASSRPSRASSWLDPSAPANIRYCGRSLCVMRWRRGIYQSSIGCGNPNLACVRPSSMPSGQHTPQIPRYPWLPGSSLKLRQTLTHSRQPSGTTSVTGSSVLTRPPPTRHNWRIVSKISNVRAAGARHLNVH